MQAVIFGMFGISSLQRRMASPVHCACASALKAKLAVEDSAENEAAKARAILALRMVLVRAAVMVGSCVARRARCLLVPPCAHSVPETVMSVPKRKFRNF